MQQWREISFFSGYEDIGYQINGLSQYFSELTFFFQYFWLVCSAPDMPTCRSFSVKIALTPLILERLIRLPLWESGLHCRA